MSALSPVVASQPDWLYIAQTFERGGVLEMPGKAAHPTILAFFRHTTLRGSYLAESDETPWCSAFACAVMEMAGRKSPHNAAAMSWLGWGQPLNEWKPGCIVVLEKPNHVGFYVGHDEHSVHLLGGNQSNSVCTKHYPLSRVAGKRWPAEKA